jgi:general secretion pathway protein A
MYNQFWGFREKPFKLVPSPDFLFLSSTHEDALAHLNYMLVEGQGFLMITGEVGTGKSTLCRAFLAELDATVVCAYIFNPKLDALQLLKTINTEFGIRADAASAHELIETLNSFLIEQKALEKKVIIIIDEAQNLSVEALEQLRLLSNLETTQQKLLQIVLVGQPELAKMIDSFELRQLGQRINLACHLRPLSYDEVRQYVQHRLNVASQKPQMPFRKGALRAIYDFSGGVPRLINTACDRMLLAAYLQKQNTISGGLAAQMVSELTHRGRPARSMFPRRKIASLAGAAVIIVAAAFLISYSGLVPDRLLGRLPNGDPVPDSPVAVATAPASTADVSAAVPNVATAGEKEKPELEETAGLAPSPDTVISLDELIGAIRPFDTRRMAAEAVLHQWGLEVQGDMALSGVDDPLYFKLVVERHGLYVQTVGGDLDELVALDLPAIIGLRPPDRNESIYAGVVGIQDGRFVLAAKGLDGRAAVDSETLMGLWDGVALIPWKNYMGYRGVIPDRAPKASVVLLKQLLWEIGFRDLAINDHYDAATRRAVMEIQAKHGLAVDGQVGNLTRIVLYNEKESLPIPRLRR